jgi:hypothetical protein
VNKQLGALNIIAPIPTSPLLYEVGATYYTGIVTFRVEILSPTADNGGGTS